ncbi:MAG: DUF1501 domain-containing protein [Actinobacteria bacterium]|nr:DUF1501 domain-containing protein [Actinomycetota bacterium]
MARSSPLGGGISRRQFLGATATAGAATVLAPRLAFAAPQQASEPSGASSDVLVLLFLRGGADGLSLVAPFAMGGYHDLRPSIAVQEPGETGGALPLEAGGNVGSFAHSGTFGLHPRLQRLWDGPWASGDLAIVHAAGLPGTESATRSHFEAMRHWESGTADLGVNSGFLNRYLNAAGATLGITGVGNGTGVPRSLSGPVGTYAIADPAQFALGGFSDPNLARGVLGSWYGTDATDPVRNSGHDALEALARVQSVPWASPALAVQNGATYPNTALGRDLREVAQLIRADVGLRVACVDCGSWDTHEGMVSNTGVSWFHTMVSDFGDSLAAFAQDLGAAMNAVTLVTMSEFGRTINENGAGGTDHGRGSVMFAMGSGIRGGVYGDFVSRIEDGPEGDLTVCNDCRTVLSEVLAQRGAATDLGSIFPTYDQRPFLGLCER